MGRADLLEWLETTVVADPDAPPPRSHFDEVTVISTDLDTALELAQAEAPLVVVEDVPPEEEPSAVLDDAELDEDERRELPPPLPRRASSLALSARFGVTSSRALYLRLRAVASRVVASVRWADLDPQRMSIRMQRLLMRMQRVWMRIREAVPAARAIVPAARALVPAARAIVPAARALFSSLQRLSRRSLRAVRVRGTSSIEDRDALPLLVERLERRRIAVIAAWAGILLCAGALGWRLIDLLVP